MIADTVFSLLKGVTSCLYVHSLVSADLLLEMLTDLPVSTCECFLQVLKLYLVVSLRTCRTLFMVL